MFELTPDIEKDMLQNLQTIVDLVVVDHLSKCHHLMVVH